MKHKGQPDEEGEVWTFPVQDSDPAEAVQESHPLTEILELKWDSAPYTPTGAGIPLIQFRSAQGVACM